MLLSAHCIIALRVYFHLDEQELLVFEKQKRVSTTTRIETERPGVGFGVQWLGSAYDISKQIAWLLDIDDDKTFLIGFSVKPE